MVLSEIPIWMDDLGVPPFQETTIIGELYYPTRWGL